MFHGLPQSKLPSAVEIEVHLFEFCNLSCSFCGQDHKSTEGMSSILDRAEDVVQYIIQKLSEPLSTREFNINVMGGELFNDKIDNRLFEDYHAFCRRINNLSKQYEFNYSIQFVTNLIFGFEKKTLVRQLLDSDQKHLSLATSYDFSGRGFDLNKQLVFKKNIEYFKDYIAVVGFVLTKPAIAKFMNEYDGFFKSHLYMNYPIYFDHYVPEGGNDKLIPSDEELLACYKKIVTDYPDIEPIKGMMEKASNRMTCYSPNKITILPSGKQVTCRYREYDEGDFNHPIDYNSNSNIIQAFLEEKGCMTCEFFSRCQFHCFVQWDHKNKLKMKECLYKELFEFIQVEHEDYVQEA